MKHSDRSDSFGDFILDRRGGRCRLAGMGFFRDFFLSFKKGYYDGDSPEEKAFKEKASKGDAEAQFKYGVWCFQWMRSGKGPHNVVVDGIDSLRDKGYAWLSIAATNGHSEALRLIENIDAQTAIFLTDVGAIGLIIPPDQIAEAQKAAKKMIDTNTNLIPAANGSVPSAIVLYMDAVNFSNTSL